ncbi:MAG: hypothetical protein M1125_02050 [Candidatus Marsarchaeota archaeon]|nr:hypothetical protein [Candidatus Marsarchaeota archaeon]
MEDYEIIEHAKSPEKDIAYIIKAINYAIPTYIRIESGKEINVGSIVQVEGKQVFFSKEAIGSVSELKSGAGIPINTDYDIKYTGGYSKDGKTIYLARTFPKTLQIDGKEVSMLESIGRHHELVEKWLVDDMYEYAYAHEIATKIERQYVESLGVSWESYNAAVGKYLHDNYEKKLERSPADLDVSPYVYSNDTEAMKEIRESVAP